MERSSSNRTDTPSESSLDTPSESSLDTPSESSPDTPSESSLKESAPLFRKITKKMGNTLREHGMIGEGGLVLVGLYGGKDSLILLKVLAEIKAAMPFCFRLTAAHIEATSIGYTIDHNRINGIKPQGEPWTLLSGAIPGVEPWTLIADAEHRGI